VDTVCLVLGGDGREEGAVILGEWAIEYRLEYIPIVNFLGRRIAYLVIRCDQVVNSYSVKTLPLLADNHLKTCQSYILYSGIVKRCHQACLQPSENSYACL
jgi:hypothetical protein